MLTRLAVFIMGTRTGPKIMSCGDRDDPTQVVLRIRTTHADDIASGIKNHEYRMYRLDDRVRHIWLFEDEQQAIRYEPHTP